MQAKVYDDCYKIDMTRASDKLLNNPRIQEIMEEGFTSVGDVFIEYDRYRFEEDIVFLGLLQELQRTDTSVVLKDNSNQ